MITFRTIYEKLFHSFRTMSATNFLDELKSEKIEKVIILQRSWIYGLFVNLLLPIIIVISVIDFSLIRTYEIVTLHPLFLIVGGLFILSSLGLTVTGIAFLRFYRENHRRLYEITETSDIALVRANILMSDRVFSHFFNQITGAYYMSILLMLTSIFLAISIGTLFTLISGVIIVTSFILCLIVTYYRRKMIDLQMDYIFVVPGKIYFIDQKGVYERTQALRLYSNIQLITSTFPNFLGSLMNYGTIEIVAKNDLMNTMNSFNMHYVDRPMETVNEINQFINEKMVRDIG